MVEKQAKLRRKVFKHETVVVGLLQVPYLLLKKTEEKQDEMSQNTRNNKSNLKKISEISN